MIRPFLASVALVGCLTASVVASAETRIAITAFEGDSGEVRDAVVGALEGDELSVIGKKEVNRAVDKLGDAAELSEKQARRLATDLSADAVVAGHLERDGRKKSLKLKLFVHGKKQKGFTVQFANARSPKFKELVREAMLRKLAAAEPAAEPEAPRKKKLAARADDEEDPLPTAKKKKARKAAASDPGDADDAEAGEGDPADDDEDAKPRRSRKRKAAAVDDEDEDEDDEDLTPTIAARAESPHTANRVAARIDLGASLAKRTLIFTSNLPENQAPRDFRPNGVPGVRVEAELYPLAFSNPRSIASGLGIAIDFDRSQMTVRTSKEPDVAVPVKIQHYVFGARFRVPFGRTATSPTATLGFGYGRRSFLADRGGLAMPNALDLPDTDYTFLAPSLAFRVPLATKVVALVVDAQGMMVTNAGPIQEADSYGRAKVFGIAATAGFDFVIRDRFAIRVVGELTQIGYTFVGAGGALANGRDSDPTDKDVGGAEDRTIGGTASFAVLY
ncbi:MAG: hypothetical protein ACTHU0_15030 [Kofleriaceae bacterium]